MLERLKQSRLFYLIFLVITALFLTEVGFRFYLSLRVGPRIWFYGTPLHRNVIDVDPSVSPERRREIETRRDRTVTKHKNVFDRYTKFFPHERKVDVDPETGEHYTLYMNSRGMRGPEFSTEKPPGSFPPVSPWCACSAWIRISSPSSS